MAHGIEDYYRERTRFARRVSLLTAGVSLFWLLLMTPFLVPPLRQALTDRIFKGPLDARRFGFEGPEQYVRRVFLDASGPEGPNPGRPTIVYRSARATKGGRAEQKPSDDPHARPETRSVREGPGESSEDLVARARVIYGGSAPVMQSEDLIIERLVKPVFPPDAQERGVEGRVAIVALVDTLGTVARADLLESTGERQFEEASRLAVLQCRFRPYLKEGRPCEVYAVFRFAFRLD